MLLDFFFKIDKDAIDFNCSFGGRKDEIMTKQKSIFNIFLKCFFTIVIIKKIN